MKHFIEANQPIKASESPDGIKDSALTIIPTTLLNDVTKLNTAEPHLLVLSSPPSADQHPVSVYLRSLSTGSRRTMQQALDVIALALTSGRQNAVSLDWGALRYQHTAAVRSLLSEHYAPTTANKMLSALRGVLKAAWRLGQIPTDEYQRAVDFQAIRGETLPAGRSVNTNELRSLFQACARDMDKKGKLRPQAIRDAAIIAMLYGAGLRRSEIVALDFADYNSEDGEIRIRRSKGRKDRLCYAGRGTREALTNWLKLRGDEPGPLFWPMLKSGRSVPRRLTDQAILYLLQERTKQAGINHLSPHDMRRTFISDLLDAGADISSVQKLAGHANVSTTIRYDRRGEAAKRKAAELIEIPEA